MTSGATRGEIPAADVSGPIDRFAFSTELVALDRSVGFDVEAIRAAGSQLIDQHVAAGRRGLAMCGVSRGVGVTFVAANLALVLAQGGLSTLLIDANLRDPGVDKLITPQTPGAGLQQFLRSASLSRSEVIHAEVLPNLSVMLAGGPALGVSELIGGERMRVLIADCLRDYDLTIIDTPPANRSADARAITAAVGYGLIVARRGLSRVDDVATLARELQEDGAQVIGAVFNGA